MRTNAFPLTSASRDGFDLAAYRRSISEMFGTLSPEQQRLVAEQLAVLPRHIHALAASGKIVNCLPKVERARKIGREPAADASAPVEAAA